MNFKQLYEDACNTASDINEHLPIMLEYAKKCKHITEMGVRSGVSTRAFLYSDPDKLFSYDLYLEDDVKLYFDEAKKLGKNYQYISADVLNIEIEPTELLFIDTLHSYKQIQQELKLHADKVSKYIIFHDIVTWGVNGESWHGLNNESFWGERNSSIGIVPAIEEFLQENPHWQKIHWYQNNNGLGIIERTGEK